MAILAVLLGIGPIVRWKKTSVAYLVQQLSKVALISLVLGVAVPTAITLQFSLAVAIGLTLAFWICGSIIRDMMNKTANKESRLRAVMSLPASYLGMQLAHFGGAVMIVGVCLSANYSLEKSVLLSPGQSVDLGRYDFVFNGTEPVTGPNYIGDQALIVVNRDDTYFRDLNPEKRIYVASNSPSTEMAIESGFLRDLFVTLGERKENGAWSMSIYIKPFIRWVWLGSIFMALGGITAAVDRRYRKLRQKDALKLEQSTIEASPQTAT
jgi:cytochrome c-type biogenesis protein CcmF